jgi:hypothetical protein
LVEFCGFVLEVAATLVALAAVFVSMPIWIGSVAMLPIPLSELAFGVVVLITFFAIHWILRIVLLSFASLTFRVLRLMNAEEAAHFPLSAHRRHLKPWPENWQEPINAEDDTEHRRGCYGRSER